MGEQQQTKIRIELFEDLECVLLPEHVLRSLQLQEGDELDLEIQDNGILLTPSRSQSHSEDTGETSDEKTAARIGMNKYRKSLKKLAK